jgi:hypothetical protein
MSLADKPTASTQGPGNASTDVRDHVKYATGAAAR